MVRAASTRVPTHAPHHASNPGAIIPARPRPAGFAAAWRVAVRAALTGWGVTLACHPGLGEPVLPPPTHDGFYVTTRGSPSGSGAGDDPWDLATALAGGAGRVSPGDTVWIRAGTYRGFFETALDGSAAAPIIFRQYPGERARIDGGLRAEGSYLTFWGIEIFQSDPLAWNEYLLRAYTASGRFVNLVLHDGGYSGVSFDAQRGAGVELYGSVIYNNGTHENVDHGIYAHNATTGIKYITDNVLFNNYARGIQVYADGDPVLHDIRVTGNIAFNNGSISAGSTPVNLLISAQVPTAGMVASDNVLYASPGVAGINLRLGDYDSTYNGDVVVRDNYAAGGVAGLQLRHRWSLATVRDNVVVGSSEVVQTGGTDLALAYDWGNNRYYRDPGAAAWEHEQQEYDFASWRAQTALGTSDVALAAAPAEPAVFVRPNRYEAGRAFVAVVNWGDAATVPLDLSGVLTIGARFEIRNVQDLFGAPVVAGTFDGNPVAVPMSGVNAPLPGGRLAPRRAPRTAPEFDVFLVTPASE